MAIPRATVRLQLHKGFGFDDAAATVAYYHELGISHVYASPILTARSGSTHGYDIVDPTHINPELGGEDGLRRFVARLRAANMGLIVDIVPNHMGVGPENPWWQHVLEWGQASPYARWFDIDWHPADESLHGKLLAPFLGQPYGDTLASGDIKLQFDAARGKLFVSYYAQRFPVAPADYLRVLRAADAPRLDAAIKAFEQGEGDFTQQQADVGQGLLRELYRDSEGASAVHAALAAYSVETQQGFDALHGLLERQHYRLAWWRCAADGINWRRFFEVTDLAGVRVEQDDVFEATHALVFRLYTEGLIDGLRIDHVDGLADPGAYCRKLRGRLEALTAQRPPELPPAPAYLIVEKILAPDEPLRADWRIDGTTGYDFMEQVGALLHDPAGEAALDALWSETSGLERSFAEEVRQARRQLLANNLAGEFDSAARALHAVARTDLRTRDFSLAAIRRVFAELLVHFPVYRTYADANGRDELDQAIIDRALEQARNTVERTEAPLLDLLAHWLGGDAPRHYGNPRVRRLHQAAITRFQQLTPPLAAKSVEDTAFYRYGRLLSRNEVGADPGRFSMPVPSFHAACIWRTQQFPHAMLATATHDHKRGEDVRARLAALSEMPESWSDAAHEWMQLQPAEMAKPQPADELMLYQTLAGAWPIGLSANDAEGLRHFAERVDGWQTKALREAKQVSDWVLPNEEYEATCRSFLQAILNPGPDNLFLPAFLDWLGRLIPAGAAKSLAQIVLRMTTPGVPDLYQGTDFWDFSLVDPDNRRPVDYPSREKAMQEATPLLAGMEDWESGIVKQQVIRHTLNYRAQFPDLFSLGEYVPLDVQGPYASHAIAFMRRHQDRSIIVIAAHLPCALLAGQRTPVMPASAWEDTAVLLPDAIDAAPTDILTGNQASIKTGRLLLRDALSLLPVALLAQ
ncbi:MAG TPA: malto-oligosyltrehalose synthase [Noviherbaspirillum sp.]|uniref:malto-oligosyltrehalose synthase n=1 Tax=Noviherbaspirillum sp. TaxID=1926288 RepID=UPI002B45F41C|nr:malto-oligosyltrehalose synthase [Noviherbaspirillum sp.]HJV87612.1 malto-oligosyltrehalose synthase [Noviherbaspirillum sp.]